MDSSASIRTKEHSSNPNFVKNEPSNAKTIGFAILIILSLGGLVVAGIGLGGYLQVSALSSIGQINSMIMMAAGGGGGILLLITGIVGSVKNYHGKGHQQIDHNAKPVKSAKGVATTAETHRAIYGADAWKIWNVEVLDDVPPVPLVDMNRKDKVLLYIPQRIRFDGKEMDFDMQALIEIKGDACKDINPYNHLREKTPTGWILIDTIVSPESRWQIYEDQKEWVEKQGYHLPSILEAMVLNLMVFDFTGERLYGLGAYTCCAGLVGNKPVYVGGFGPECRRVNGEFTYDDGLHVKYYISYKDQGLGAARVQREFKDYSNAPHYPT